MEYSGISQATIRGTLGLFSFLALCANSGATTISGTLSSGFTPSESMTVLVQAINLDSPAINVTQLLPSPVFTTDTAIAFNLDIPNGNTDDWILYYNCSNSLFGNPVPCSEIVNTAYYNSTVMGSVTYDYDNATIIKGNIGISGVAMTILAGNAVQGSISLPSGVGNASSDIDINILAQNKSNGFNTQNTSVRIASGTSSEPFKITLPDDNTQLWTISYDCNEEDCSDYVQFGYYDQSSANNTSDNANDADELQGGSTLSNINMELLNGLPITGTVNLPGANMAPVGGMEIRVTASDLNSPQSASLDILISKDASSANYSLTLPNDGDADWILSFGCNSNSTPLACADYISPAYYDSSSANATTALFTEAESLGGGGSYSNKDVTMMTGPTITGKLALSQGVAPAGGIHFIVRATRSTGGLDYVTTTVMSEGESTAVYSINVLPDASTNWKVNYDCADAQSPACAKVTDIAYYSSSQENNTTTEIGLAEILSGGDGTVNPLHSDIDMLVDSNLPDPTALCFPIVSGSKTALVCL